MAYIPCRRIALCLFALVPTFLNLSLDFSSVPAGHIVFKEFGVCLSGNPAYLGLAEPQTLTRPNEFYIEMMGGAVCFNKGSCTDSSLSQWTDIRKLLVESMGTPPNIFDLLTAGVPLPLNQFGALGGAWLPGMFADHPLEGMRGIFIPTCTADVGLGRHDAKYDATSKVWYHHGGMQLRQVLTSINAHFPDLTKFFIQGGSGGGVASAAWLASIADQFPNAQVRGLVDSGFHLMPGTDLFKWFYNNVVWSPGPGGQHAKKIFTQYNVPTMNWLSVYSFEERLKQYNGRVKVAYIGCDEDGIVFSDRQKMGEYVTNFNDSQVHQVNEMWNFLTTNVKCAIPGTVWSWVAKCGSHHLTRRMGYAWSLNETRPQDAHIVIPGEPSTKQFVYSFLKDQLADPTRPDKYNFWYENRTQQLNGVVCPQPTTLTDNSSNLTNDTNLERETNKALVRYVRIVWLIASLMSLLSENSLWL